MDKMKFLWEILNSKIFFIVIAIILGLLFIRSCDKSAEVNRKKDIIEQNLLASQDTIKTIKTKNGELNSSINSFILTEKQLKETNKYLFDKVNKLDGQLLSVNRTVFKLIQDTTTLKNRIRELEKEIGVAQKLNDSTWSMTWGMKYIYDDLNYDYVSGITTVGVTLFDKDFTIKHLDTKLLKRETQMELTFGQRVVDDKLNIFLQTNYPGFSPSVMEGTFIDPNDNEYIQSLLKKKHWFPNEWNVGLGSGIGYDFLNNRPAIVVGVNATYSIYKW